LGLDRLAVTPYRLSVISTFDKDTAKNGAVMTAMPRLNSRQKITISVVFEGLLWLSIVVQAAGGIVAPLIGLAHQSDPPGSPGDLIRLSGGANRLDLDLTEAGIKAVYGQAATVPADGTAQVDDLYLTPAATAQVTLEHTGPAEVIATAGSAVLGSIVLITAFAILINIVRTIRHGDPFDPRNSNRLYALGATLIGGWAVVVAVHAVSLAVVVSNTHLEPYVNWSVQISLWPIIVGLGVVMLAVVFDRGASLRADTEGLV
jgi:hypothetical protein